MTGRAIIVRGALPQQPHHQRLGDCPDAVPSNPPKRHAPIRQDTARRLVAGLIIHRFYRSSPGSLPNALNLKALEMQNHGGDSQEIPARV